MNAKLGTENNYIQENNRKVCELISIPTMFGLNSRRFSKCWAKKLA